MIRSISMDLHAINPFLIFLITLLTAFPDVLFAGNSLHTTIDVRYSDVTVEDALEDLGRKSGLTFSYNPSLFPVDSVVSYSAENASVEEITTELTGLPLRYKVIGDIVILRPAAEEKNEKKKSFTVSGAITDKSSGKEIGDVSVIMVESKYAAQTKEQGNFDMEFESSSNYLELYISKKNYRDTVVHVPADQLESLDIALEPISADEIKLESATEKPSVEQLSMVKLIVPSHRASFAENLQAYSAEIPGQISFLPFLGSSLQANSVNTNTFSLNILAGYSGGVEGAEVGGLLNIVRGDVKGIQVGGLGNVVGGTVNGIQIGGLGNNNRHNVNGAQIAGFYNIVLDSIEGVQFAGYVNLNHGRVKGWQASGFLNASSGEVEGGQLAGFLNVSGQRMKGAQIAGFSNISRGRSEGLQFAGYVNVAGNLEGPQIAGALNVCFQDMRGLQLSGLGNVSGRSAVGTQIAGLANLTYREYKGTRVASLLNFSLGNGIGTEVSGVANVTSGTFSGVQVAGIANAAGKDAKAYQFAPVVNVVAGNLQGVQVSSLVNLADNVKGLQLSVLNIADTVRGVQFGLLNIADSVKGVSIGLLSLVKNGYKALTIDAGDSYVPKIALKLGVPAFYNIISYESSIVSAYEIGAWGFGAGAQFFLKGNKFFIQPELTAKWYHSKEVQTESTNGAELSLSAGRSFGRHIQLSGGPSAYCYWGGSIGELSHIQPQQVQSRNIKYWVGYKLGISLVK